MTYMAIDNPVCFHRQIFANLVKTSWDNTRPVELMESANKNWCGFKLLPMSISTYPVDFVHLIHLLKPQHQCLCFNGRECPPSAYSCTSTIHLPLLQTHLLYTTPMILQGLQKYLKNQ